MPHHITFAHALWKTWLTPTDRVVDATCGTGQDTLVLAQLAAHVEGFDLQEKAIEKTRVRLTESHLLDRVTLHNRCHSLLERYVLPPVRLIVYNFGYLPGGDKTVTTCKASSLASIQAATRLVGTRGALSLMLYPGHAAGRVEAEALIEWANSLPISWIVQHLSNGCLLPGTPQSLGKAPELLWLCTGHPTTAS